MSFALSPSVTVVEQDLTSIVPAVATSPGAFAGVFQFGPINYPINITSENQLVSVFGKPNNTEKVFSSFFTAANFLSYANNLNVVRADGANYKNAAELSTGSVATVGTLSGGTGYTTSFNVPTTGGGGTGLTLDITASAAGQLATVTKAGTATGSGSQSAISQDLTSGTGTGATFNISESAGVYSVAVVAAGHGYLVGDTLTFYGNHLGGVLTTNDLVLTVATVTGGVISGVVINHAGSGYSVSDVITITTGGANATVHVASVDGANTSPHIMNILDYNTNWLNNSNGVGQFAAKYPGTLGNSILFSVADSASYSGWTYQANFPGAPGTSAYASSVGSSNDELHIIVIDILGLWTGTVGTVLEKFSYVSKASDCQNSDGSNNYYVTVVNANSNYLWWTAHPTSGTNWGNKAAGTSFATLGSPRTITMTGGVDDFAPTDGVLETAFSQFANHIDVGLIMTGHASSTLQTWVIQNISNVRLDCLTFVSAYNSSTGNPIQNTDSNPATIASTWRALLPSSSYAVADSGFKYQYDRYNDTYRNIPLNGDTAGLCARTSATNADWYSPAGYNRGQINNVVRLLYNPSRTDRDTLYSNQINPVITKTGVGTVLLGDHTMLAKPSAFQQIGVRRCFIVLEKSISTAAGFQLFEFNDAFTQAQFMGLVTPFLRTVQGQRGIVDFKVVCDSTVNTSAVINAQQFIANIFIIPNQSINYITLNFIAEPAGASFTEIGG